MTAPVNSVLTSKVYQMYLGKGRRGTAHMQVDDSSSLNSSSLSCHFEVFNHKVTHWLIWMFWQKLVSCDDDNVACTTTHPNEGTFGGKKFLQQIRTVVGKMWCRAYSDNECSSYPIGKVTFNGML